jgi:hypothetical protein
VDEDLWNTTVSFESTSNVMMTPSRENFMEGWIRRDDLIKVIDSAIDFPDVRSDPQQNFLYVENA